MAVGLTVILSLVLVGLAVIAGAFVVHKVSASLFSSSQGQIRPASAPTKPEPLTLLQQEGRLVEQRRAVVAVYATSLAAFKIAMSRQHDALGRDAAEARRREDVLTGLALECIGAVEQYNLAAQAFPATQLQSAGLPERFVWAVDCAQAP